MVGQLDQAVSNPWCEQYSGQLDRCGKSRIGGQFDLCAGPMGWRFCTPCHQWSDSVSPTHAGQDGSGWGVGSVDTLAQLDQEQRQRPTGGLARSSLNRCQSVTSWPTRNDKPGTGPGLVVVLA